MYQSYLKLDQLFLKNIIIALVLIVLNKSLSYIDYANGQSVTQMYLLVVRDPSPKSNLFTSRQLQQ